MLMYLNIILLKSRELIINFKYQQEHMSYSYAPGSYQLLWLYIRANRDIQIYTFIIFIGE